MSTETGNSIISYYGSINTLEEIKIDITSEYTFEKVLHELWAFSQKVVSERTHFMTIQIQKSHNKALLAKEIVLIIQACKSIQEITFERMTNREFLGLFIEQLQKKRMQISIILRLIQYQQNFLT
eukprot:maker-scaffold_10-snap-gene-13.3-mRNA-1 protein AED:0.22 eAED:0.22 QI:46/1/1/1/0/0/2/1793/124